MDLDLETVKSAAALLNVVLLPIWLRLETLNRNLAVITAQIKAHEQLDETRFEAHERRVSELMSGK